MSYFKEYETVSGFNNSKDYVPLCNALHEMVHIQGPASIHSENILPTASSLTQFYNVDPKLWTRSFIGFMINVDKNNFIFVGNKENTILLNIHQNITPQKITFQFDLPMY